MTSLRLLHTSDLHLGKRFGQFDEETRAALQQARMGILPRLAETASKEGAGHVLIAGDLFDTETPSARVIRQALAAMAAADPVQWWIIPGNHDSGAAEPLWAEMARHAPQNVHLLMQPTPVEIAPGATLLPAPCERRFAGLDRTIWMDSAETPDGHLRIGLAHGAVLDFDRDQNGAETIATNRAESARLDYLALGDWHGDFSLNTHSRYSGTPERDRFKHPGRGSCLLVDLPGPGQLPQLRPVEMGQYHWQDLTLDLAPGQDIAALIREALPGDPQDWPNCLIRIRARGWVTVDQHMQMLRFVEEQAPAFCHLSLDGDDLRIEHRAEDLDQIATTGALRAAAEELMAESQNSALAEEARDVAAAALNRLYAVVREGAE
ncbi:metallophosphoesterase family protein [Phaeobacter gallaeciensis]|uniref:metallophosphoesterase family protein n=1 Tax=Phaeobacter gallaeciensis TaxID=60890 RepID=UPI000BBBD9D9|nr:metallophosphoesterase [Phaeobacter gallaeciensis]ATF17300.1 DNA repair exonuclease [Phaeobacter gallaeciensis]ATF21409.1 DNA repair exonuclease [Phaeobacter gallaeciensis]